MKTVKEIRDFNDKYRYMAINAQNTQNLNQFVFDVLIGITEHLEAQPERSDDTIRRAAMLKALRWCDETTDHAYGGIAYAIARIENGGDL
jgi:hypothetical protein